MSIATVWYNGLKGNWDNGLLMDIFDSNPQHFLQYNDKVNPDVDRAIVLVNGCPQFTKLRSYLESINEAFVFLLSEEDAYFRWEEAIPERHTIFTQYYSPITKFDIKNRILLGAPNRIKDYSINSHLPKKYLWSFIGQSQNPFRQECIEVAKNLPNGFLHVTELFGGEGETGMDYQSYLDVLCQSKFVLCPAGSQCVDSFRVYESILCGAIPIVNKNCPRDDDRFNYWDEVYYWNNLLKVDNWYQVTHDFLNIQLSSKLNENINNWWGGYVRQLTDKLISIANDK